LLICELASLTNKQASSIYTRDGLFKNKFIYTECITTQEFGY
jgi:hypothetical protein